MRMRVGGLGRDDDYSCEESAAPWEIMQVEDEDEQLSALREEDAVTGERQRAVRRGMMRSKDDTSSRAGCLPARRLR